MIQAVLTPAAGKRLIARAVVSLPVIQTALQSGTIVVVAGTTNGYVAEELLALCAHGAKFSRERFFRGITLPPGAHKTTAAGRLADDGGFPGDVVIRKGAWLEGATIFDVIDDLAQGDVILKGANAVDLAQRLAAVLIGDPKGGTLLAALQAVVGRRVRLILPVGLEKRVSTDLVSLARRLNAPGAHGARLMPVAGDVVTEIDALEILTGAKAELMAAGGVCGAEGTVWLAVFGTPEQEKAAKAILAGVMGEAPFTLS